MEPDRIDGVNLWVKSLRFKVPMLKGTPDEFDTIEFRRNSQPNGQHVETVVLLSKGIDISAVKYISVHRKV